MTAVPESFPTHILQTAIVQGLTQAYARRSMRQVRYGVRLPDGTIEPAVSAHHISAIIEAAGGPESRFTGADASNYLNGRHSKSLLDRLPPGMEIYSLGVHTTDGSRRTFSAPTSKQDSLQQEPCPTDPEPVEQECSSTCHPSEALGTVAADAGVKTREETASEPPPRT